jgi:hypothetical protein
VDTAPAATAHPRAALQRCSARAASLVVVAVVLAVVTVPWRPSTLCLLRALTGVPCPFCGGTTAVADLGRGHPLAALGASPLATLGAPLWVAWPALDRRVALWRARAGRRRATAVLLGALALAEAWQLHRFLL